MRVEKASVPSDPSRICARLCRRVRHERVEIVAADAALHFRESASRSRRPRAARCRAGRAQAAAAASRPEIREAGRHRAEMRLGAVGEHRVDRENIVAHRAVAQRAAAAGIVRRHAADRGARGGRDVDREPEPVGLEPAVQVVEHDAGLDRAAAVADVELVDVVRCFEQSMTSERSPSARPARCRRRAAARSRPRARRLEPRSASASERGATTPSGIIW